MIHSSGAFYFRRYPLFFDPHSARFGPNARIVQSERTATVAEPLLFKCSRVFLGTTSACIGLPSTSLMRRSFFFFFLSLFRRRTDWKRTSVDLAEPWCNLPAFLFENCRRGETKICPGVLFVFRLAAKHLCYTNTRAVLRARASGRLAGGRGSEKDSTSILLKLNKIICLLNFKLIWYD